MNTVKKIAFESLPQSFSPNTLPEILKLAKAITGNAALVYERQSKPFFMETDRLIVRHFMAEDGKAFFALAIDRMNSPMQPFDEQWPTDLESCKGATEYLAGEDGIFAVCLKPSMKLIGTVLSRSFSGVGKKFSQKPCNPRRFRILVVVFIVRVCYNGIANKRTIWNLEGCRNAQEI
ncbi:MAG: GNAT family N-acetyltransferase [Oscillospiraceae bacterium]|jgi:hypothetical protein|nr:GNAT family N-acetyltransferase [Oscillospiraceae bacterium]